MDTVGNITMLEIEQAVTHLLLGGAVVRRLHSAGIAFRNLCGSETYQKH
jgi:hypothetical protein